jgi:hypothetical protein
VAQQRAGTDEGSRREIPCEALDVRGIETLPQGNIRRKDLPPHQIIHGHPLLGKDRREPLEQQAQFLIQASRSHAGLWIDANASGEIEGVPGQDGIAEGERGLAPRQYNVASGFGLGGHFLDSLLSLNPRDEATI